MPLDNDYPWTCHMIERNSYTAVFPDYHSVLMTNYLGKNVLMEKFMNGPIRFEWTNFCVEYFISNEIFGNLVG